MHMTNKEIGAAMTIKLDPVLPEYPVFKEGIRRAPMRDLTLSAMCPRSSTRLWPPNLWKSS